MGNGIYVKTLDKRRDKKEGFFRSVIFNYSFSPIDINIRKKHKKSCKIG